MSMVTLLPVPVLTPDYPGSTVQATEIPHRTGDIIPWIAFGSVFHELPTIEQHVVVVVEKNWYLHSIWYHA